MSDNETSSETLFVSHGQLVHDLAILKMQRMNNLPDDYNDDRMYKPYADGREKEITIKEKIIEILCGTEEMTPRTAEKILNDTKELIASTAMDQPINKKNDQ